jgi:hypothetical protein
MAKAHVTTPAGISVQVEGTPAEIAAVVEDLERKEKGREATHSPKAARPRPGRVTLASLLEALRDDGFFKEPRELGSIKKELDAKGHLFPVTTLSGAVLEQVRKRNLRRIKKDGRWTYVRA